MAIAVRALFFAAYRDRVGASTVEVELPDGAAVGDLVTLLRRRGGPWETLPAEPAVAVNRRYAPLATPLAPGDEVAFIPPVAGG